MIHISYFGLFNSVLFSIILFISFGVAGGISILFAAGMLFCVIMLLIGYLTFANGCPWDSFVYSSYSNFFLSLLYGFFFAVLIIDFLNFNDPSCLNFHIVVRLILYTYFSISGLIICICSFIILVLFICKKIDEDDLFEPNRLLKKIIC